MYEDISLDEECHQFSKRERGRSGGVKNKGGLGWVRVMRVRVRVRGRTR